VYRYFDVNGDGFINTKEFIRGIRGELSSNRHEVVMDIWKRIAKKGSITADDVFNNFDVSTVAAY
jgi:Ca2+-binding EF-hand superfamily protein